MIIDYTPEELQQFEQIQAEYAAALARLHTEFDKATAEQDGAAIDKASDELGAALRAYNEKKRAYHRELEQRHFAQIAPSGPAAVLEDAKKQAPACLADIIAEAERDAHFISPETIEAAGVGKFENGKLVLFYDYAKEELQKELALYIDKLSEDKEAAAELAAIMEKTLRQEKRIDNSGLAHVKNITLEKYKFPVDKVAFELNNSKALIHDGKYILSIDTRKEADKTGTEPAPLVSVVITLPEKAENEIELSQELTAFDRLLEATAASLIEAGQDVCSLTRLYKEMGNTSRPSPEDIERLQIALEKGRTNKIKIDNIAETRNESTKKYARFKYDGVMLPSETIAAYIDGKYIDTAVHFFRTPPRVDFAKSRDQIGTAPKEILAAPINKTEGNLKIQEYLCYRISRAKHDQEKTLKIEYGTLFDRCGINTWKQRDRAKAIIKRYLTHYASEAGGSWITGWKEDGTGTKAGAKITL